MIDEAKNPNTPPERLQSLAQSSDEAILRELSLNPNTPLSALDELWRKFPDSFLHNPATPLFLLEDPTFYAKLNIHTITSLLALPGVDNSLLHFAWSHHRTYYAAPLSQHAKTPPEILYGLLDLYSGEKLVSAIAKHPNTTTKTLERIIGDASPSAQLLALSHPALAPDLVALRPKIEGAIQSGDLSDFALEELCSVARCGYLLRTQIAMNPKTPGTLLVALFFGSEGPLFDEYRPGADRLPLTIPIRGLNEHRKKRSYILPTLAKHPNVPEKFLRWMLLTNTQEIIDAAAKNVFVSATILEEISDTKREPTKISLLSNPNLTEGLLLKLLLDQNSRVAATALHHPNIQPAHVEKLFSAEKAPMRRALASREETPAFFLEKLFDADEHSLRPALYRNPKTPRSVIEFVKRVENQEPLTEPEIMMLLQKKGALRELFSLHPQATPELELEALRSPSISTRTAMARLSKNKKILEELAQDPEVAVSKSAQKNLLSRED